MNEIKNQPYLVLDDFVDQESFNHIVDSIILGIAKSKYAAGPTYTGPGYLDKSKKSVFEIYREIISDEKHPYHNVIKDLKNWAPFTFIQYKWPSHVLGQCLILRSSGLGNYSDKHDSSKCFDFPIIENFRPFLDWIEKQNIFSSFGRIVIFLNEAGTRVLDHRDYEDGISRKDQFIWMSPLENKPFYIRDDSKKIYLNSKFCYFDNSNIHGSDEMSCASFSIRIDGKFTKEFIQKINLEDYFDDI